MTNRRKFVVQCSIAAAAASLPASMGLAVPMRKRDVPLELLTFGAFRSMVGSRFDFFPGAAPVRLQLVQALAFGAAPSGPEAEVEQFSLIFQGPENRPLTQDTYPVAHDRLGRFVMFLAPVWAVVPGSGIRHYQANFYRPAQLTR